MAKLTLIRLDSLVNMFDVRTTLDEERVEEFANVLRSGKPLPPIEAIRVGDGQYAYIDGRHRAAAHVKARRKEIAATILSEKLLDDPAALLARALKANTGGSKPPTRADMAHTVLRMMEAGAKHSEIREHLGAFLPATTIIMLIQDARSTLLKRKIAASLRDISTGTPIAEAAAKQGVSVEQIKTRLVGGGRGLGGSPEQSLLISYKAHVTNTLKPVRHSMNGKINKLLQDVDSGDMTPKQARIVLDEWRDKLRDNLERLDEWETRLAAIEASQQKAEKADAAS